MEMDSVVGIILYLTLCVTMSHTFSSNICIILHPCRDAMGHRRSCPSQLHYLDLWSMGEAMILTGAYQTLKPNQTREKSGIHTIPHHQLFVVPAVGCSCSFHFFLPCATATSNLSSFLVRFASEWRTMQRNIASCP